MTSAPDHPERSNRGRFQKGQSGNPGGRPKKLTHSSPHAFDIVIDRTLPVTSNGVERQVSMEEALQIKTYHEAIAGKRQAQKQVIKWIEKRGAYLAKTQPQQKSITVKFQEAKKDPHNAEEAIVLLGIATHNPDTAKLNGDRHQLLLEPWAVEAALKRRRNAKPLQDTDIEAIRRWTRDANKIPALTRSRPRNG